MKFSNFIYRLGGAQPNVIAECNPDTQGQYKNLGYSVLLCTLIAAISGADITHQYTPSVAITVIGAVFFALLTFSFDYFINNSSSNKIAPKLLRIPVALANVCIGTAALMVMLNQSKIDSKLRLQNTGKIVTLDRTYQTQKEERYAAYQAKKKERDQYYTDVCLPEARRGYPGKEYQKKFQLVKTTDSSLVIEKAALDTAESAFYQTYFTQKDALVAVNTASFPEKCAELPAIFKENWFTLLIAICVFIVSFYVECQSLIMKFSINKSDDYNKALSGFNTLHNATVEDRLKKMIEQLTKLNGLKEDLTSTDEITKWANDKLNATISKTPIHYKLNEYQRILNENGLHDLSSEIAGIKNTLCDSNDLVKAMNQLINKINKN